ncbi:MAG: hypothetical protein ACXWV9_05605, partial [Flavisolibacter sp.]
MGRKNSKKPGKPGKKRQRNFNEYKGVIEITRSGMGFVVVEGLEADILIRPNDFNTAMHGDT